MARSRQCRNRESINFNLEIMTNEERAMEILCVFDPLGALEEMANWKDQQFKEYLEKKQNELDGTRNKSNYELLEEIINELFKED